MTRKQVASKKAVENKVGGKVKIAGRGATPSNYIYKMLKHVHPLHRKAMSIMNYFITTTRCPPSPAGRSI